MAALIIGKYVPEPKPLYYIAGEGEGLSWDADKWIAAFEVSTKLDLKAGDYKLKVVDGENWKGFSDLTTQADGLSADEQGNICFKLDADGEVNVHYEAEFFFLNGEFHVEPAPAVTYYMKNNWDGGEWSWKEMVKDDDPEETRETHVLANVVFGGTGVNINTVESDEGAFFVAKENIVAFDLNYDAAELGELDTVVFYFHPDEVNRYNLEEENGLAALIIGKYVPEPDKYYMKHNFDGENWDWREMTYMSAEEAGDVTYKLEDVIFRGGGVNINTAESDEGAMWIEAQYIEAYDLNYEPATLEAGDKVVFMFVPELVSVHEFKYGLSAIIIEKAAPVVEPDFYIAGSMTNWADGKIAVYGDHHELALEAGEHKLKVIANDQWIGFDALTTVADGLFTDGDGNVCFVLDEAGVVNVHYDGEYFFLNGNFHVDDPEHPQYFLKNNWNCGEDWTWLEMTRDDEAEEPTYVLSKVIFGGTGVNLKKGMTGDEEWIVAEAIEAFDLNYDPAVLEAGDLVTFVFKPENVNHFTGENGLSVIIIKKDVLTGIDNTEAASKAVKVVENGVIYIIRGDKKFNANGQLVK